MASKKKFCFVATSIELKAATGDDQDVVPFEVLAYGGGLLNISGFPGGAVVDISGVQVVASSDNKLPITLDHKDDKRIGHAENVEVDLQASQIRLNGITSASSEARSEVLQSHRSGFRFQASIEGIANGREFVKRGKTVRVNGRIFEGPIVVVRKFVLRAVSFVSAGGDQENQVRLAASNGDDVMDPKYTEWLSNLGLTADDSNDKLVAKYEAELKASSELKAPAATESPASDPAEELKASLKQINVEAIAERKAEIKRESELSKLCGDNKEIFAKAMLEDWSTTKTELELLRASRESGVPAFHTGQGEAELGSAPLAAAMLRTGGINPDGLFSEKELDASDRHKTVTLHSLMHDVIRAAGLHANAGNPQELVRTAYEAEKKLQANAGFSTIGLADTLSNVANKSLLKSYQSIDGQVRRISSTKPVKDFKEHTSIRLNGTEDLEKVGPTGEIKHTKLSDSKYTTQIYTFARMLALTRQMQINDDLGAFLQIPMALGRAAARTEEKLGWAALQAAIATGTFFTAPKGNLITGALDTTSLTAAKKKLKEMTDADGNFIMVSGKYLVTSPALADSADRLMNERTLMVQDHDTASTKSKTIPVSNPHVGAFEPVSSPYFGAAGGGTDTQFLIAADPADIALLEFAHLNGQQQPIFESAETDFNTLGIQWRIYRDFGWAVQDDNAAVFSLGT